MNLGFLPWIGALKESPPRGDYAGKPQLFTGSVELTLKHASRADPKRLRPSNTPGILALLAHRARQLSTFQTRPSLEIRSII